MPPKSFAQKIDDARANGVYLHVPVLDEKTGLERVKSTKLVLSGCMNGSKTTSWGKQTASGFEKIDDLDSPDNQVYHPYFRLAGTLAEITAWLLRANPMSEQRTLIAQAKMVYSPGTVTRNDPIQIGRDRRPAGDAWREELDLLDRTKKATPRPIKARDTLDLDNLMTYADLISGTTRTATVSSSAAAASVSGGVAAPPRARGGSHISLLDRLRKVREENNGRYLDVSGVKENGTGSRTGGYDNKTRKARPLPDGGSRRRLHTSPSNDLYYAVYDASKGLGHGSPLYFALKNFGMSEDSIKAAIKRFQQSSAPHVPTPLSPGRSPSPVLAGAMASLSEGDLDLEDEGEALVTPPLPPASRVVRPPSPVRAAAVSVVRPPSPVRAAAVSVVRPSSPVRAAAVSVVRPSSPVRAAPVVRPSSPVRSRGPISGLSSGSGSAVSSPALAAFPQFSAGSASSKARGAIPRISAGDRSALGDLDDLDL